MTTAVNLPCTLFICRSLVASKDNHGFASDHEHVWDESTSWLCTPWYCICQAFVFSTLSCTYHSFSFARPSVFNATKSDVINIQHCPGCYSMPRSFFYLRGRKKPQEFVKTFEPHTNISDMVWFTTVRKKVALKSMQIKTQNCSSFILQFQVLYPGPSQSVGISS